MTSSIRPFPLVPRRHFAGVQFGERRSPVRGSGSEVAGSRLYRPGDRVTTIDWGASARLSAARGDDQFVVREHFAEQAPRVALVLDRRRGMRLYGPELPWLDKHAAARTAAGLVAASAAAAHGELGYADGELWLAPGAGGGSAALERRLAEPGPGGDRNLARALDTLSSHRRLFPPGSFVFVVSDFLSPPPARAWMLLKASQWDVTPVVVQDPTWEQSFPRVGGVVLPVADPLTGAIADVLPTAREAEDLAAANEARLAATLAGFRRLGLDPVVLGTHDPAAVAAAFHTWAERRRRLRGRRP